MDSTAKFRYGNREYSREELRNAVEAEAAGLPPEQWLFGKFEFDEWLSDCLVTGHVERVNDERVPAACPPAARAERNGCSA